MQSWLGALCSAQLTARSHKCWPCAYFYPCDHLHAHEVDVILTTDVIWPEMARSTSRALHTRLAKVIRRCNLVGIRPSRWLAAWTVLLLLLFRLLSYGGEPLLPAVFVSVSPLRLQPLGEYAIDEVHTPEISRSSSHEAERMLLQGAPSPQPRSPPGGDVL